MFWQRFVMLCSCCGKLDKDFIVRIEGNLISIVCRGCYNSYMLKHLTETYDVTVNEIMTLQLQGMDESEMISFFESEGFKQCNCSNCEYGHCKDPQTIDEEVEENELREQPIIIKTVDCGHSMEEIYTLQNAYGDGAARYCPEFYPLDVDNCAECGKKIHSDVTDWKIWVEDGQIRVPCCSDKCADRYSRKNEE